MCWNAEISLNTFIYACISAVIVYNLGVITLEAIIILLSVSSMQLLEYFIWTYINDDKMNELLSKIGLFIIFFQLCLIINYNKNPVLKPFIILSFSLIILLLILTEFKNIQFKTTKASNGHLRWHWIEFSNIWIILILSYYIIPPLFNTNSNRFYYFLFVFSTLIISLYTYHKYKTWGSMWCYISNLSWILLIIYSLLKINGNI